MYAIVKSGGKQYRVEQGQRLLVERLAVQEGNDIALEPVLYRSDEVVFDKAGLGEVTVTAKVVAHVRGEKLRVFKFKPKRGYKRRTGHRQDLTQIEVTGIARGKAKAAAKPAAAEPAAAKPAAAKPAAAKAAVPKAAAAKRAAPKPAAAEPGAADAQASQAAPSKPAAKPRAAKPRAAKPAGAKPARAKPAGAKPAGAKRSASKPAAKPKEKPEDGS
ncbi:MAG TPA: 50S ribosomal protein L21 [Solirubrobacteraceae bacterium]|nr:50S ribosomal protein L21 [Solirubrobacteraceae bacterium]